MDVLFAAVEPLVWTTDDYRDAYGVEDPEELALMQLEDVEHARMIAGALHDLFMLDVDLVRPRSEQGPQEEVGAIADLHKLREVAAAVAGRTVADYHEGRVQAGYRFQHLINHDDQGGYYLPVEFLQPFWLGAEEDEDSDVEHISVGSALVLLQELEELRPTLRIRYPREMAAAESGEELEDGAVRIWQVLLRLCRASLELDLPLVFG